MFSDSRVKLTSKLPSTSIHVLDDDSLLNIFRCYRLIAFDSDNGMDSTIRMFKWDRERWWYKLVQVCRRWRYLILGSASYLRLCLVCTLGTPVADMLESSPPLPLVVSYNNPHRPLTAGEEKGLLFALQQRDRIRTIYLQMPLPCLREIATALDDKFPMLESLYIRHPTKGHIPLTLPPTFEAPHLRHLNLHQFAVPMGSPLFTTAIGLMTLILRWIHPHTYSDPNHLLQTLSPLSQLHTLEIGFSSTLSSHDIPWRPLDAPTMAHVTLPNLRWFSFWGISDYLEAILPHMTTPCLAELKVHFFNHFGLSVPHLLQFVNITENPRFGSAKFVFHHRAVGVFVYPHVGTNLPSFDFFVEVSCTHLDQQVSSVAQIFSVLSPLFSTVMDVTLDYRTHVFSSGQHNQANRTRWRELLGSFRNVETLRVHKGLVGELSRSLRSDALAEPTLEVLPDLKELVCPTSSLDDEVWAAFVHDREVAGQPVKLTGETFPAGYLGYSFDSPGGVIHIDPDTP